MSKTALDLSRAIYALGDKMNKMNKNPLANDESPECHRFHRLARGADRLRSRLRAIPADAVRHIKELEARDKMTESIRRDWYRDVVKGDAMTEGEHRVRAMSTELLERNLPAVGQARSQWQAMSKGLLDKKPDCPLCKMLHSTTNCEGRCALYVCVHEPSEDMPVDQHKCGPEYVRWVSVSKGTDNDLRAPAVIAAASEMAELLDQLHGVIADELADRHARAEEAKDLATEWHGFKLKERVRFSGGVGSVVGGNGMCVVVNPDDLVILVYIRPGDLERVLAKPKDNMHGFSVGEPVQHKHYGKGVVEGPFKDPGPCSEPYVSVRYDEITFLRPVPSAVKHLSRVPPSVQEWNGFREGEKVFLNGEKPCTVVGGEAVLVFARNQDGTRWGVLPSRLSRERTRWHGFNKGERVRHNTTKQFGAVVGGSKREVLIDWDHGHKRLGALPCNLTRIPATEPSPDRRCGTCAYWPKDGPPDGVRASIALCDPSTQKKKLEDHFGVACDDWKARDCESCSCKNVGAEGCAVIDAASAPLSCWTPKPKHDCSTCKNLNSREDSACDDFDCGTWIPGAAMRCWKPRPEPERICSTCWHNGTMRPCPSGTFPNCWAPTHLCSECADHGKCDGDSTPENGCWRVEPEAGPGWDAQTVMTVPILPPDVKDMRASFSGGRIVVEWTDTVKWVRQTFGDVSYEDGTRLERIINELSEKAGFQGKAGD